VDTMDLEPQLFRSVSALQEHCLSIRPDIVSLDLFDTLMFREALSPECIFHRMLNHEVSKKGGLNRSWPAVRKRAGRRMARFSLKGETTLSEIYSFLRRTGVLPAELVSQMMEIELLEERCSWRPYIDMLRFAHAIRNQGIRVIIYSDTYLPFDALKPWIDRFLPGVALYCSSATMQTKTSGRAFAFLETKYPGAKILHIGDNVHSDGIMPRKMGIQSAIIDGPGRFSSTLPVEVSRLARLRGLKCLPYRTDGELATGTSLVVAQWAYGWALFLICFLEAIARFVKDQRIEEVWFSSRDCETLFHCLNEAGRIVDFPHATYIYASGSSLAPLVTSEQSAERVEQNRLCESYIRAQLSTKEGPGKATRLLLVDIGGKGTLQRAVETALGDDAVVHGYYVALHPTKTWLNNSQTACFFEWNRAKFCEPMTEMMFGFVGDRCAAYRIDECGVVVPVFQTSHGDASDPIYTKFLRRYLTELLKENWRPDVLGDNKELTEACSSMVQRFHMFPRKAEALAIANWSYKSRNGKARSIGGDGLSLAVILSMRGLNDNYWPHGALARRMSNRILVYILQKLSVYLRELKRFFQRMR
jgi:FMN phosphatase YigB (HAD superfamily)